LSPKLPRVTPDEVARVMVKLGFSLSRQSGSHRIYRNSQGKRVMFHITKEKAFIPKC